jgi:amidase
VTVKRLALVLVLAVVAVYPLRADKNGTGSARLQLVEATITDIQKAAQTGLASTADIVEAYLQRIAAYDKTGPRLNAYLTLNPNVLAQAQAKDAARHPGKPRKPLDGIPILLKDNVDTADMQTSAGSVALTGSVPPDDATITRKLRVAGAVIMGKATLTEFANFLTNGMPAGYSSLGGYGFNPFDPRPDPRPGLDSFGRPFADGRPALSPGGSSSGPGIATSANLTTVAIGTETSGSILSPGTQNLLVGIKPTVGLVSRDGIVPITADQDTAGPLARTVTDAAKVLGAIAGNDPSDPATAACLKPGNCFTDYTQFLDANALAGKRIAVPQTPYVSGLTPSQLLVINEAIKVLQDLGATVDPVEIPTQTALNSFPTCGTHGQTNCSTVLLYGFKRDLNSYLSTLNGTSPSRSLADVIKYNATHPGATKYGQDLAIQAELFDTTSGSADTIRYQQDRAEDLALSRGGLNAIYAQYDAILFPANRGANIAARAGYPSIVVPGGFVVNAVTPPFPPDFNAAQAPYGVTFSGPAFSEPKLIGFAYAFEQATHHRVAPASVPPLPSDSFGRP